MKVITFNVELETHKINECTFTVVLGVWIALAVVIHRGTSGHIYEKKKHKWLKITVINTTEMFLLFHERFDCAATNIRSNLYFIIKYRVKWQRQFTTGLLLKNHIVSSRE